MKAKLRLVLPVFILSFCFLISSCGSGSQNSPQATFKSFVKASQTGKTPADTFAFYDWEGIFNREEAIYRENGINSPEELRAAMEKMFKDPVAFMKEKLLAHLASQADEGSAEYDQTVKMFESMAVQAGEGVKRAIEEEQAKNRERKMTLGKITIDGDTATGEYEIVEKDGSKRTEEIKFIKRGKNWYIVDLVSASAMPVSQ